MTQHATIQTHGRCEDTGKIKYASRADAKKVRERMPEFKSNRPYLCDSCGAHHLGRAHGTQSREEHRAGHVAGSEISVRMAAEDLCVTTDFLGQLLDAGKIRARQNENGKWRIPVNEITRIKTLLMEDA